jgi:hypothetical protein
MPARVRRACRPPERAPPYGRAGYFMDRIRETHAPNRTKPRGYRAYAAPSSRLG